jgi:hypothetical protein
MKPHLVIDDGEIRRSVRMIPVRGCQVISIQRSRIRFGERERRTLFSTSRRRMTPDALRIKASNDTLPVSQSRARDREYEQRWGDEGGAFHREAGGERVLVDCADQTSRGTNR